VSNGVYFGWAKIESDSMIYPTIANIGKSPTFAGQVCSFPVYISLNDVLRYRKILLI